MRPLALPTTAGNWYRGLRLAALDGSTLSIPVEVANRWHFGLPGSGRGRAGFPKLRLTALVETGTRAPLAWCGGPLRASEMAQAERLVPHLSPGLLVFADRYYCGFPLWSQARASGAHLLWRIKSNQRFPVHESFPDGSWRSVLRGSGRDRKRTLDACTVRALSYRLAGSDERFTLVTTLLDPVAAPAADRPCPHRLHRGIWTEAGGQRAGTGRGRQPRVRRSGANHPADRWWRNRGIFCR